MNVGDLVRAMEQLAPLRFAAPWDNVGLLVGDASAPMTRVLLAIDCTIEVLAEAKHTGCEAIVAYHPPIFDAQKRFVAGSVAFAAAHAGIAIHSPHTALDVAEGGTNDVLADALGMSPREPLRAVSAGALDRNGPGRVGPVESASVESLVQCVKVSLGLSRVLVAGPLDRRVSRAAVCAGSGGELVPDVIAARAELYLTGEMRHHDALRAAAAGVTVVCTLHSASERAALIPLARRLGEALPAVVFSRSVADREPFDFV